MARLQPQHRLTGFLVAWYGFYQLIHIGVNIQGLFQLSAGSITFPAPPPPGGWTDQAIAFFIPMASLDLFNAFLTMLFVYGYFTRRKWRWWLGIVTLTVSLYAAFLFNYATWASDAWTEATRSSYLFINITFLPVAVLYVLVLLWAMNGRFAQT
ncbi:MAG: hypothetical protein GXP37_11155 [Chloroflexi bacterium]|nr:hypothetical protein [Chloroflexota bacterium]